MRCRSDSELESFTEVPSSVPAKSYHTRDHTYSYDKLRRLSATSEAVSMNYWPVPRYPAPEPLTYFHPLLTPPAAVSLAPLIGCRASEMPSYFVQSPSTASHMTMIPAVSVDKRPTLRSSQSYRGSVTACHSGRSSLLLESNIPLDLTVGTYQHGVHDALSEMTSTCQNTDTSPTSRSSGGSGLAEFPANVTATLSSYVASLMSHSFTSQPPTQQGLIQTTQCSEATKPVTMGASVEHCHRGTVLHLAKLHSASTELLQSHTEPQSSTPVDFKPVLAMDVPDQAVSDRQSVSVPKVECSGQESMEPGVTCSSLSYVPVNINYPDISQVSVASSVYSATHTSNTVTDSPQPSEIHKLPCGSPSTAAASTSSSADDVRSPEFPAALQSRGESLNILTRGPESDVGLAKMEVGANDLVKQRMLGLAGVDSSHGNDDWLLSAVTEAGSRASDDKVTHETLVLPTPVQTSDVLNRSPTDDLAVKPETSVTYEDAGGLSALLSTSLDHSAEALTKEPCQQNTLSERRTDFEPVSDSTKHDAGVSENVDDNRRSLNDADSGCETADVEVTGVTAVSAVNTASGENINASEPEGRTASEPNTAAVAMESNTPAAESLQHDAPVVRSDGNADDTATSAVAAETDENERFRELMVKCTKALELCLTRFPQHYKSLYRLADVFFRCSSLKVSNTA